MTIVTKTYIQISDVHAFRCHGDTGKTDETAIFQDFHRFSAILGALN